MIFWDNVIFFILFIVFYLILSVKDGFASNLNVRCQTFDGNFKEYAELTKTLFDQFGWMLMNELLGTCFTRQRRGAASLVKARKSYISICELMRSGDNIILATVNAYQNRWDEEKEILMLVVNRLNRN